MRPPLDSDTSPPGAVFAVAVPGAGCVIGDVRPDRLLVEVTGAGAEFGCLEPYTHQSSEASGAGSPAASSATVWAPTPGSGSSVKRAATARTWSWALVASPS
jgi:hypothetical protein